MKKIVIIILILFGLGATTECFSQSGGKKREKHARRGKKRGNHILTQYKSHGHADDFARGSNGRRGKFARLFHKSKPSWKYKSAGSARSHERENRGLFTGYRSTGKTQNADHHKRQGSERSRNRVRGSKAFMQKRNYKSR